MKPCYNYKQIFDEPAKIRKIFNLTLPFALPLARFIIAIVVFGVLFIGCRGIIQFLDSILGGIQYVLYVGLPWVISGAILKLNPDGQRLHHYLIDLLKFVVWIYIPKKRFCQDEVIHLPKKAVFDKYKG